MNGESMGHTQREKKVFHSQKFMFPSGDGVLMASMLVFSVCVRVGIRVRGDVKRYHEHVKDCRELTNF